MTNLDAAIARLRSACGLPTVDDASPALERVRDVLMTGDAGVLPSPRHHDQQYRLIESLPDAYEACLEVAIDVSGVERFELEGVQGASLYLDPIASGADPFHVFVRDEDVLPGGPWFHMASSAHAVEWLASFRETRSFEVGETDAPLCRGGQILERVIEEELCSLWHEGGVASGGELDAIDSTYRGPGWQRELALHALDAVLASGQVPPVPDDIDDARGAFWAHLRRLAARHAG